MTLDQLRIFVAVAERQHVTRAAEALNLAQSAASAAIAALEGRHGAKLFHRVGRGIELTEVGSLFLTEARAVLARADAAELVLSELGGLKRGRLLVQASQTIARYWLPRHLVAFRQTHPGLAIALTVGNTAQVAAAVHEGAAELGFIEGTVDDPILDSRVVARDQLVIVVGPEHDWARSGDPLTPRHLAGSDWVLREPGSGTRSVFEAALVGFGISPACLRVVLELRPTRACVPPSKRAWGRPRSPLPPPCPASRQGCCTPSIFDCRSAIFASSGTSNATIVVQPTPCSQCLADSDGAISR